MTADTRVAKHSPADRELQDRAPAAAESHMSRGIAGVWLSRWGGEREMQAEVLLAVFIVVVQVWNYGLGVGAHISRINLASCVSFHFFHLYIYFVFRI